MSSMAINMLPYLVLEYSDLGAGLKTNNFPNNEEYVDILGYQQQLFARGFVIFVNSNSGRFCTPLGILNRREYNLLGAPKGHDARFSHWSPPTPELHQDLVLRSQIKVK